MYLGFMPLRWPNDQFFFLCKFMLFSLDLIQTYQNGHTKSNSNRLFRTKLKLVLWLLDLKASLSNSSEKLIYRTSSKYYLYLYKNEKCRSLTYLYEICKHYLIWYENSFKNLKSSLSNFRIQCSKENSILNIRAHAQVQQFQLVHRKLWNTSFVMLVSIQHFYIGNTGIQNFGK